LSTMTPNQMHPGTRRASILHLVWFLLVAFRATRSSQHSPSPALRQSHQAANMLQARRARRALLASHLVVSWEDFLGKILLHLLRSRPLEFRSSRASSSRPRLARRFCHLQAAIIPNRAPRRLANGMCHPEVSLKLLCSPLFPARQQALPPAGRADLLLDQHQLVKCSLLRLARPFPHQPRKMRTHRLLVCRAVWFSRLHPARPFLRQPRRMLTHHLLACRAVWFSRLYPARPFLRQPRRMLTHHLLAY
jgi:hypothetical protein